MSSTLPDMHRSSVLSRYDDLDAGPRRAALILVGSLGAFVVIAGLWMSYAKLDIAVRTRGSVVPSSRVQLIQSLEGGLIREIAVSEGHQVHAGDLLARLENVEFDSALGESQQQIWSLRATLSRLEAEIAGRDPHFDPELQQAVPGLVQRQLEEWHSRELERKSGLIAAREQVAQRRRALAEGRTEFGSLRRSFSLAQESLAIEQKLSDEGVGARADLLTAMQRSAQIEGQLRGAELAVPRLQAAVQEAEAKVSELESGYKAKLSAERNELMTRLAALTETVAAKKDRVSRRDLHAPVDGVVNRLLINTIGGVAKPGESLMELVPIDDKLLVTARVKPADIAFIHAGQDAKVRVTAYDSSIFGALPGKVVRVGADALTDERKEPYFEVQLETDRNYLGDASENLTVTPGMTTDISIMTGQRTILEYLLKPIVKTLDTALRER